jgi:Icc-related predicted phosphoesterase
MTHQKTNDKKSNNKFRVAAMGDLHVKEMTIGHFRDLFQEISEKADALVLCGDLTDLGLPNEAEILAEELSYCKIPVVGVLGNHDYEKGMEEEVKTILQTKMFVLDEEPYTIGDVGFAGVKGFGGGFNEHVLSRWGEKIIKEFVNEAVNEALKLENQLSKLETEKKVVAMHYSPIKETIIGEPEEIHTYLGCSRLANPINWYGATVVFHGHAHHGTPEGRTLSNIPVYNCSIPVMTKKNEKQPYALIEI